MSFPKRPEETFGYSMDLFEPYYDNEFEPAAAGIYNGHILNLKKIWEWKEAHQKIGKYLEEALFPEKGGRWKYPTTPKLPAGEEDLKRLHQDLQRCNDDYIEFPDSRWASVFATWQMGSYLVPFIQRSPLLLVFGPSGSGKGQVLDQVDRLCYRGRKMISPTPAVLYRLADQWGPTFALDEVQDLDKETRQAIMQIVKGTYDGTPVSRCDNNTQEVLEFRTRSFIALSLKGSHPPEDFVKNRAILFTMRQNSSHKKLVPDDSEEHRELRARLLGLRLKLFSEPEFMEIYQRKVIEKAVPETLGFDRRPRDIAISLLLPAIMCGEEEDLIETIGKSSTEAKDAINSTFEARVQYVIEENQERLHGRSVLIGPVSEGLARGGP